MVAKRLDPPPLLTSLFLTALLIGSQPPARSDNIYCLADGAGNDTCVIRYPNVLAPSTNYPTVALAAGDTVTITAGGCVQTGGVGKTWKSYVNPSGPNSASLYHGTISIFGVTAGLVPLKPLLNTSLPASTGGTLTLGYEDDNRDDNGYWSHDDGTEDQCSDVSGPFLGRAWLTLVIHHVSPPFLPQGTAYGHCSMQSDGVENCHIDRPDVTHGAEEYPGIAFRPGAAVEINAGGCVQTGGSGRTWKHYVFPSGPNADHLYFGKLFIPGVTPGLVPLKTVINSTQPLPLSTGGTLTLGYEDDNLDDNGYWSHDDGTEGQCADTGPAWIDIKVRPSVRLDAMEVTQVIQDVSQSVPLVAGKTTWARLYLSPPTSAPMQVTGVLRMTNTSGSVVADVAASAPTAVRDSVPLRARREAWDGSLNFAVPASISVAGKASFSVISLTDTATGTALGCDQCSLNVIDFTDMPPLRLRLLGLQYSGGTSPGPHAPRPVDFTLLQSWLARGYPVAAVNANNTTVPSAYPWPFDCLMADSQVAAIRANDVSDGTDNRTHYLGLVFNGGGFMRGCAYEPVQPDPSAVGSLPTGSPQTGIAPINVTGDTDATFGDWYGAHELAHTFGRFHPGFCNGNTPDDPGFPNPNGQISDNLGTDTGLDVGDPAGAIALSVLPGATTFDIMTYCNQPQWLSAYTYAGIGTRLTEEDALPSGGGPPGDPRGGPTPGPAATLSGAKPGGFPATLVSGAFVHMVATVDLTAKTGKIRYVFPVERSVTQTLSGKRAEVRVLTSQGHLITAVPADLRRSTDREPGEPERALVDVSVPFSERMSRLELVLSSKVIDGFSSSTRQPPPVPAASVTTVSNALDPSLAGYKYVLRWKKSVLPGDPLTYIVETSADRSHWDTIGVGLTDPALGLTPEQAHSVSIRIFATNGFRRSRPLEVRGTRN